jgi:hypothetical protein
MRFRTVAIHAGTWPIRIACRVLGVSASGYYAWRDRPDSDSDSDSDSARAVASRQILTDIRRLHASHRGCYGSPRLQAALQAEGSQVSRRVDCH